METQTITEPHLRNAVGPAPFVASAPVLPPPSAGADDFCFCGNEPVKGLPYCLGHARIAYRSLGRQAQKRGRVSDTTAAAPPSSVMNRNLQPSSARYRCGSFIF
jgi:GcrA cell cycle regulator